MSMGGLLASALGGAASSGMAMADKVATEEKAWDREKNRIDLQQRRDITLEGIRAGNAQKLQTDRQTFQGEQNDLNRQTQLTAANINASNRTAKVDPRVSQRIDLLKDLYKAESSAEMPDAQKMKTYMDEMNRLTSFGASQPPSPNATTDDIMKDVLGLYGNKGKPLEIRSLKDEETKQKAADISSNVLNNTETENPEWKQTAEAKLVNEGVLAILNGETPQRGVLGIMSRYNLPPDIKAKVNALLFGK